MVEKKLTGDPEDFRRTQALRIARDRRESMSDRLERVHLLCKQMTAIKGAARSQ